MSSRRLILLSLLATSAACVASAQVLYDASLGTPPEKQGWSYGSNPLAPLPFVTVSNSVLFLDSTAANSTQAGYGLVTPTDLNRSNGFALSLTLKVTSEGHSGSAHRAGFSVIALGSDAHGIELGFWTTSIWAQADTPMFTRAESANFATTTSFVDYTLAMGRTSYSLFANGNFVLSGPVRDYTPFSGFPDPYETPNLLFFGDDTGSAQAAWSLKQFALVQTLVLSAPQAAILTWTSASKLTFSVEASTNLTVWSKLASVSSPTEQYAFTNAAGPSPRFLRVRFP